MSKNSWNNRGPQCFCYWWFCETEQFNWWFLCADRHLNASPQYLQW